MGGNSSRVQPDVVEPGRVSVDNRHSVKNGGPTQNGHPPSPGRVRNGGIKHQTSNVANDAIQNVDSPDNALPGNGVGAATVTPATQAGNNHNPTAERSEVEEWSTVALGSSAGRQAEREEDSSFRLQLDSREQAAMNSEQFRDHANLDVSMDFDHSHHDGEEEEEDSRHFTERRLSRVSMGGDRNVYISRREAHVSGGTQLHKDTQLDGEAQLGSYTSERTTYGNHRETKKEYFRYVSRSPGPAYDTEGRAPDQSGDAGFQDNLMSSFGGSNYGSPVKPQPPKSPLDKPSPVRMAELDRHVISTPSRLLTYSVFDLVQYLARAARTEAEMAYVIYRWVTCLGVKDDEPAVAREEKVEEEETGVPTVMAFVEQVDTGRLKHADLFSILCKCTNLETHKVSGRVRHYAPQPSSQLCRSRQASWSAILLKDGWGLVDCFLGARHWEAHHHHDRDNKRPHSQHSSRLRPHHEFAPHNFYFLPQPQLLVTSHLPDNPCWQLLPHPVAEMDFFSGLLQKPHLHFLGVELVYPTTLKVRDIEEEAEVTWKVKGEEFRKFAFRLFCVSDDGLSHKDLTRYGFLETQHARGHARLRLIPPASGRYVCELYGAHVPTRQNEMTHMCSFDMDFVKTTSSALKFPENERVEWGPGGECLWLGMRPLTHEDGYFQVEKGQAEIIFSCSRLVLVTQKLFVAEEEGQGKEVPRSTVNFRDTSGQVRILLRIPHSGDYILSLYAKDEGVPGKCQLVCNYLVLCGSGLPPQIHHFPPVAYNKLGPTKAFSDFKMNLVCPKKSCIVVAPFSGKVLFAFNSPPNAELSSDLLLTSREGSEQADMTDYVQQTCQENEVVFRARIPEAGVYIFHLYGRPLTGEGHKFLLYSAMIECSVPCKDCLPLTRVIPEWRSRVQILAPLRKYIVLGAVTHFAVRAFKVKAVTVQGKRRAHKFTLESDEEEDKDEANDASDKNVKVTFDNVKEPGDDQANTTDDQTQDTTQNDKKETSEESAGAVAEEKKEDGGEGGADAESDGWQVWRCSVTASNEDEGSGVKLCVQDALSEGPPVCVAQFEVITERKMAANLEQQQAAWAEAEQRLRHRPDSGHRSNLDDEETQQAYFLDDDVYVSNPLGDDYSDDSDDDDSSDDDEEYVRVDLGSEDDFENEDKLLSERDSRPKTSHKASDVRSGKTPSQERKPRFAQFARAKTDTSTNSLSTKRAKTREKQDNARNALINKIYCTPSKSAHRRSDNKTDTERQKASMGLKEADRKRPKTRQPDEKSNNRKNNMDTANTSANDTVEGKNERNLRRKMWKACQKRDREAIVKTVKRYTRGGYPPCADLAAAQRMLHVFELKDALLEAIDSKDLDAIRSALTEVERNGYAGEMCVVCRKAHALLSPNRATHRPPDMAEADMRTLLEIRSYRCPPEVVHHVVVAMLLLMGVHEGLTKKWSRCRRRLHVLGSQGLFRKMSGVEVETIHPEIAARASDLLDKHTTDEALNAGPGPLALMKWSRNVIARVEDLAQLDAEYGDDDPIQPAGRRRQREIFKEQITDDSSKNNNNDMLNSQRSDKRSVSRDRNQDKGKQASKKATTPRDQSKGRPGNRDHSKGRDNRDRSKGRDNRDQSRGRNNRDPSKGRGNRDQSKGRDKSKYGAETRQTRKDAAASDPKGNQDPRARKDNTNRTKDAEGETTGASQDPQASDLNRDQKLKDNQDTREDQKPGQDLNCSQDQKPEAAQEPRDGVEPSQQQEPSGDQKPTSGQKPSESSSDQGGGSKVDQLSSSAGGTDAKPCEETLAIGGAELAPGTHPEASSKPTTGEAMGGDRKAESNNDSGKYGTRSTNDNQNDSNDREMVASSKRNGRDPGSKASADRRSADAPQRKSSASAGQKSPAPRGRAADKNKNMSKKEVARSRLSAATRRPKNAPQPVFHSTLYYTPPIGADGKSGTGNDNRHTDPRGQPSPAYEAQGRRGDSEVKVDAHAYQGRSNGEISSPDI